MINVLVVDDNQKRVALVRNALSFEAIGAHINLVVCESADEARLELMSRFDLLILDVVLPKKIDSTPQAAISVALLSDICSSKQSYIRPSLIIGLTADVDGLDNYKAEFSKNVTVVLDGSIYSEDWKDFIVNSVLSLLGNQLKVIQREKDKLLITVHGIRTHGKWQTELKTVLNKYSRDFEYVDIKYGFFDLLSFAVPALRNKKADKHAVRIVSLLKVNQHKEIYIVAHSFGTYILSRALRSHKSDIVIKLIVMCGSPLPHDHDIDHLVDSSSMTINDCGIRDFILVLARCFLIGLGDAGRIGFSREHTSKFLNRYHTGGHSHYFDTKPTPTFYEKYWLPIMTTDAVPVHHDGRTPYVGEDLVDILIKSFRIIKPALYVVGIYFLARTIERVGDLIWLA